MTQYTSLRPLVETIREGLPPRGMTSLPEEPIKEPVVYIKPLPLGFWGVFRSLDRRPYMSTTSLIEAKGIARSLGQEIRVLNDVGKVIAT